MRATSVVLLVTVASAAIAAAAAAAAASASASARYPDHDQGMHSDASRQCRSPRVKTTEKDAEFWRKSAQRQLRSATQQRPITTPAKNAIMFLGDGMSIPTITAARIYQGQLQGKSGENSKIFFETFPYTGLSKTYCVDSQVADSACSATAYLGGVKTNIGTIGVTAAVALGDCKAMLDEANHVSSILKWAQEAGKATGIVTTTRVTHASPAGTYAHVADRDWESDKNVLEAGLSAADCRDIAQQLVLGDTGREFQVILGGGRREFLPNTVVDEEGKKGQRRDGQNLIKAWQEDKAQRGANYSYVWNLEGLDSIDYENTDYVMGLFESSHMMYHLDTLEAPYNETEPTLSDMVRAAHRILKKNKKGYVLFVEGGRIDHGHHGTEAHLALDEAAEMGKAVEAAAQFADEQDTLLVVTADHAHTMSISGYPDRGNDIFGVAGISKIDGKPYATLTYANGPGYRAEDENGRHNINEDDMHAPQYEFPAVAPLSSETHGGDDVAVLARGPWAHLLVGVFEQNYIPHAMAYAACVGAGATACDEGPSARARPRPAH